MLAAILADLLILIPILFVSMMAPGPDMMLIIKHSLGRNIAPALFCIIGICAGLCIHIALALGGVAAIMATGGLAFKIAKTIGGLYLIYIGIQIYKSKNALDAKTQHVQATYRTAFMQGFLTNTLNPKVMIFVLALFTQVIDPTYALSYKLGLMMIMLGLVFVIWGSFALLVRQPHILGYLQKHEKRINMIFGVLLIVFAGVLLL